MSWRDTLYPWEKADLDLLERQLSVKYSEALDAARLQIKRRCYDRSARLKRAVNG